jgi:hypothetical protein
MAGLVLSADLCSQAVCHEPHSRLMNQPISDLLAGNTIKAAPHGSSHIRPDKERFLTHPTVCNIKQAEVRVSAM